MSENGRRWNIKAKASFVHTVLHTLNLLYFLLSLLFLDSWIPLTGIEGKHGTTLARLYSYRDLLKYEQKVMPVRARR